MKTIVIYHSKTGFTKKYAEWIAEVASCRAVPFEKRGEVNLSKYDVILFGSWVHAGRIRHLDWLKRQLPALKGRKVMVFAVGAMPPGDGEDARKMFDQNFLQEERSSVRCFYLQGGLNYERMSLPDRMMMSMFRRMLSQKPENAEMARQIAQSYDCASREAIAPIVAALACEAMNGGRSNGQP